MADKRNSKKCTYNPDDSVEDLPFIGPKYSQKLENLEIHTIKDLLYHFPHRFRDTRDIDDIDQARQKEQATVLGRIESIQNIRTRSRRWLTKAQISDHSGTITAVWFNQPYLAKSMKVGASYIFSGKINSKWGGPSLTNPEYEKTQSGDNLTEQFNKEFDQKKGKKAETTHLGKISPKYPETAGVSSKWLRARIKPLRKCIPELTEDYISKNIREQFQILSLPQAIENMHFPEEIKDIEEAKHRLGLDELIKIQLRIRKLNQKRAKYDAPKINSQSPKETVKQLHSSLDYTLTDSQKKAVNEIFKDLNSQEPMYRLLNGDVGSGKTIVALSAAVAVCSMGYTTIIMAPTTILANQHYQNIKKTIQNAGLKIPVQLFTSNQKQIQPQKTDTKPQPQILIGTHALIYQDKLPDNTGLLIVDEEHRFGVAQREKFKKLASKNKSGRTITPHYLTMTATPIPRTLTLALYGETNVSTLDELPPGRQVTQTFLVPESKREDSYKWIEQKLNQDQQAFVICPLVEDSDKVDAKSAEDEFKRLKKEVYPNKKIALVHGQMKEEEKDRILKEFKNKKYDLLVATPVIEVGIDIPNSTIMIIENAERFGLAQLHQFRGRIGRGDKQGYCYLFANSNNEQAQERLKFFSKTKSGFKVAQYDLKRRGPGEVYGTRQSGMLELKFADLSDNKMIKTAGEIAEKLI